MTPLSAWGARCRKLVTANIAGETVPVTACYLAWTAGASITLPRGPHSVTGLARCLHAASGAGSFGDDASRTGLPFCLVTAGLTVKCRSAVTCGLSGWRAAKMQVFVCRLSLVVR
jgi:hypothetical protein